MKSKKQTFKSIYNPKFDENSDELILQIPKQAVIQKSEEYYEVRLPVYAGRSLAMGGYILRTPRNKYRKWLLEQQGGVCAICGKGYEPDNEWNLDHQPALAEAGSKFIDYNKVTKNRVIHHNCDIAQKAKKRN